MPLHSSLLLLLLPLLLEVKLREVARELKVDVDGCV
jgi:hypothetical protein